MSNSNQRRNYLPLLLVTGLTAATGVGGYLLNAPSTPQLSEAAQGELEAGFASAQDSTTAETVPTDSLTSAWQREKNAASEVTQVSAETPQPEQADGDRYAQAILAGTGGPDSSESSRYAAAPLPPLEQDLPSEEAHAAADTIARGQSPMADQEPLDALPEDNPLRSSHDPFDNPQPTASASLPPMPAAANSRYATQELSPVGPEPTAGDSNPLRGQAPAAEEAFANQPLPEPADFADARPIQAPPVEAPITPIEQPAQQYAELESPAYSQPEFTSQPTEQLQPLGQMASASAAQPTRELPNYHDTVPSQQEAAQQAPGIRMAPLSTPTAGAMAPAIDEGTGRPGESALEGAQRPALVIQKFAPPELQVGKEAKFTIKIRNVGQRPADEVVVNDEVPQGARLVGTTPQADVSSGGIAWQLGTLSPGEERTMEIALMPTEEGEIGSVAQVTFASHASAKSRCTRPQLALRMTAPSEVLVGRQQRITIEVHNPGTGDATNVLLLENVPENVRHQAGPALEFEIGTLRAGETRRMELVLTAEKPGQVLNVLTARADGNLQVQQEVGFEVIAPSISVDLQGPSRRYLERPATYTVSVDNPGTAPAKDVQIITKLPKGMRFVRANNLGEYDSASHSVYWSLAELPEGQHGSVELVALPVQSGDQTIEVEGRAREGLEDRTTRDVRVEGLSAIMFEVRDAQDPIEVGGSTSYEIRVVNQGSKAATNVQVTALVPPGLTVTGATGETRHRVGAEGVVFEPLAQLAPKADTIYKIEVQGVQPGEKRLLVEVKTDDITQPIRKEESTRVFGDE